MPARQGPQRPETAGWQVLPQVQPQRPPYPSLSPFPDGFRDGRAGFALPPSDQARMCARRKPLAVLRALHKRPLILEEVAKLTDEGIAALGVHEHRDDVLA